METMALLEKETVENLLPQKFPFVMVDAMHSYTETSLVSGLKIQQDNIFVKMLYRLSTDKSPKSYWQIVGFH